MNAPSIVPTCKHTLICRLGGLISPCGAHVSAVSDVHDVVEHSAPSDAVGVTSRTPKFKPIAVTPSPMPELRGAF